jgi:hypothetical protein
VRIGIAQLSADAVNAYYLVDRSAVFADGDLNRTRMAETIWSELLNLSP